MIDPTANVIALVEAAMLRQDDLRIAEARRADDLRAAESRRIDEQAALRAEFAEKYAMAESKRIDAIRAVDVNAVAVANERATQQATVLATQVVSSAEALRGVFTQTMTALSDRLTKVEQTQYKGEGKDTGTSDTYTAVRSAIMLVLALAAFLVGHFVFK